MNLANRTPFCKFEPLSRNASQGPEKLLLLITPNKVFASVFTAAAQGHAHILQWLMGKGANMNLRNMGGKTPCDVARRFGNRNCVKLLGGNPGKKHFVRYV